MHFLAFSLDSIMSSPRQAFYVVSVLHHCFLVLFLADQIFYRSYVKWQHFRLRPFASLCLSCPVFFGAVGLFRSDMLLILNMVWPWFFCRTVFVSPQFPYHGKDVIFWIFPITLSHVFCMWHWPIGKDLDLRFIWSHHHLHLVGTWMINQSAHYFIACYTVLRRLNKVEIAVHECNSWLSVWTLSWCCPDKLSMYVVSTLHHCFPDKFDFWLILLKPGAFSFAVLCMFKEITITKEFQEFNCFITFFGQTLGVFTVEYDGQSLKKVKSKRERNKVGVFWIWNSIWLFKLWRQ